MLHLRKIALLLAVVFCISLAGCSADAPQSKAAGSIDQTAVYRQNSASQQTQNLAKLCKVWGYAKYYHPAFLLGTSDWDAELLSLLSKVSACETSDDVNALLHEWFTSLGEIDYKARIPKAASGSDASVSEADLSWTADADYLGEALVGDLAKLPTMLPTNLDRTHAPVFFDSLGVPDFSNEPEHGSDYTDPDFRLLGLFRLWNALDYYAPYLHLLDCDWDAVLLEAIPTMLDGTDRESYEAALASVTGELQDAHVWWSSTVEGTKLSYRANPGGYYLPVPVSDVGGQLVVTGTADNCPLEKGDVLVSIDGETIDELAAEKKPYYSLPREDMLLTNAWRAIVNSETETMEVVVQRGGEECSFSVTGSEHSVSHTKSVLNGLDAFQVVGGNIGVLNPGVLESETELCNAMEELRNTDALIIDLRQYSGVMGLYFYIPTSYQPAIVVAKPNAATPGTFTKDPISCGYDSSLLTYSQSYYPYEKPVVILMDKNSVSRSEYLITILKQADNVTVIGEASTGADGNVAFLPLPGELQLQFTSFGIYEMDGAQTQCTGIQPDVAVHYTAERIREGRDEIMEAALDRLRHS